MNRILKYDLISLITYALLVTFGIINVYSSSYTESFTSIFDYSTLVGKQLIFLFVSLIAALIIIFTKSKFFDNIAPIVYFLSLVLLISLFFFGFEGDPLTLEVRTLSLTFVSQNLLNVCFDLSGWYVIV